MLKALALVTALTTGYTSSAFAQDHFPVPHNADTLAVAAANPEAWNGRILALEGVVVALRPGPQDKPLVTLAVPGNNGHGQLRVSSLVVPDPALEVGDGLRVMGYLMVLDESDPFFEPDDGPFHLLAIEIINGRVERGYCLPAGQAMCAEWEAGAVPSPKR